MRSEKIKEVVKNGYAKMAETGCCKSGYACDSNQRNEKISYFISAKDEISASLLQVSRNQYPVFLPNESQTSLYGDEAVKPKNIILKNIDESVLFVKIQAQPDKQIHAVQKVYKTTVQLPV